MERMLIEQEKVSEEGARPFVDEDQEFVVLDRFAGQLME